MKKIAVRIDDVTPGMDLNKMLRFTNLLDRYQIKPLIGIIPANRDDTPGMAPDPNDTIDFEWIRMKIAEGYVPAMHGCNHVYTTEDAGIFPLNPFSEFAGVSLYDQLKLIGYGKKLLRNKGIDTDVFMAPGHSYDINTLKALKHFGFKYVTDGFGRRPYTQGGLTFLPISLLRSLELKDPEDGVTTFVVHTWMMDDPDFEEYEKLFSEHRERFINYDELFKITPVRRSRGKHYAEYTAARLKRFAGSVKQSGSEKK